MSNPTVPHTGFFRNSLTQCHRATYADFVHVLVGPEAKNFGVHKGLRCGKSKYFEAAFQQSSLEGNSGYITLLHARVDVFEVVWMWLYTQKIAQKTANGRDMGCSDTQFINLFLFGKEYEMPELCNEALDDLIARLDLENKCLQTEGGVVYISDHAVARSPLRKLAVDSFLKFHSSLIDLYEENWSKLSACPRLLVRYLTKI